MQRFLSIRLNLMLAFVSVAVLFLISATSRSVLASYSTALRRYPYLTDAVGSHITINWATDRSETAGGVRYGKVGSESCTAHYVSATKTAISVNGVSQYQWKAMLDLAPGAQYCYRVYLGTSPASEVDLLGSDTAPTFRTQVPAGASQSFSFIVFGDWGQVDSSGNNSYQANLMSLMASKGARFAITTGDNGYPNGNQKNFGDLVQTGLDTSAIFGPSFWKAPGVALPLFPSPGNHGYSSSDISHPHLVTWPQDRAVSTSGGRYAKETYCCLNGSTSNSYPSVWYAFDAGPARFYVLTTAWADSNTGTASSYQMDYDYHWAPGTAQRQWLQADLAAHPSVLKFAFFHYPLYSDNPNEATDTYLLGSSSLEGLLKQNGVDLAFTGHAHIYERNLASAAGIPNYITGGGGATPGTLGTCTALDAYAIKFTTTGKACGSAPVPTSAAQVYHFLLVTVNGQSVTVTPTNSLGQSFDVMNYNFSAGAETTPPTVPSNLTAVPVSGTEVRLTWSASSDSSGVRGYGIYRSGTLIDTVDKNTLTFTDGRLGPGTSYSYRVDAFDGSANHSAQSGAVTATTQNSATYTFNPVADTYISAEVPATNYGTSSTLRADGSPDYRSYLRFNVDDVEGNVTSATLRLYTTTSSTTGYQAFRVSNQSWEEGSINYSNAPGAGSLLGSSGGISSGSWTSVDVTSLITGNGVYDLMLDTTESTSLSFNSRDATSNQPQLVILTSQTVLGPTPSRTPTSTATQMQTAVASPSTTATVSRTPTGTASSALTFTTTADARVSQASPTTNYGTGTTLQADGSSTAAVTSFIRFTTNGLSGSIQSVKLRVFCTTNGTIDGPAVYLANSTWTESGTGGINWNNQPALLSGILDNKGAFASNEWVEYDVTTAVTGNGTYTFAVVADSNDGVTFSSREGATPPQLVITLGTSTPTATATASRTATATASATATITPSQTATATPSVTTTSTPLPTATASATPSSTATLSPTPSATKTPVPTDTPTPTITPSRTPTASQTPSRTSTVTPSVTNTSTPSPTATDTITPSSTATLSPTPSATDTPTPTITPSRTPTASQTPSQTATATPSVTNTSTPSQTPSQTSTASATPSSTATLLLTPSSTDTPMPTDTSTPTIAPSHTPTASQTPSQTSTVTPSVTPTSMPSPTATDTITPSSTATLSPAPSATDIPTPTGTPMPTATWTLAPTETATGLPTVTDVSETPTASPTLTMTGTLIPDDTPTLIPIPTLTVATPSLIPTVTLSATSTNTATSTASSTVTMSPTLLATATVTPTFTPVPTMTASHTMTATSTPEDTATFTATPSAAATPIPTSTPVPTITASRTPTATSTPEDTATATAMPTATLTPSRPATATSLPQDTATPSATDIETTTPSPTATADSGNTLNFTALADARVFQHLENKNFGNENNLQADSDTRFTQISYIRFTVSGITEPIQSVKLRVFCSTNGTIDGPAAYLAENNWIESGVGGITWATRPAILSEGFDNKDAILAGSWVEYDVTALVTGEGTYTFALIADSTDGVTFSSGEGTSPPQLVVVQGP